jgi:predicted AAA+ superfamily ATPase
MEMNPQYIDKDGKKEFVVLPYQEFLALHERLEDLEDLLELRKAKIESQNEPVYTLDEVESMFSKNV